jgi:hypothetical protein
VGGDPVTATQLYFTITAALLSAFAFGFALGVAVG